MLTDTSVHTVLHLHVRTMRDCVRNHLQLKGCIIFSICFSTYLIITFRKHLTCIHEECASTENVSLFHCMLVFILYL